MSKFLKGNYKLENSENPDFEDNNNVTDFSKVFETKAFEKLGGSIAFVMKSNNFLWEDEENVNR